MLTKRIIACLDVRDGRVVKGVQFVDIVDAGDPAELAHRHAAAGADEIVLLDITATHEGRGTLLDTVKRAAARLFVPFTVGGGIRSAEEAEAVFTAGADKVSINSAAIARPALIGEIGSSFGAQAVIVAIARPPRRARSGRRRGLRQRRPQAHRPARSRLGARGRVARRRRDPAHQHGHRRHAQRLRLRAHRRRQRDRADPGHRQRRRGLRSHFADVFGRGKADAALAASIFHFGITDSRELKAELAKAGVSVRLPC
jgi:cyclase